MPQLAIPQQPVAAKDWLGPLSSQEINRICEANQFSPNSIIPTGQICTLEDTDTGFELASFFNRLPIPERQAIHKVALQCGPETNALASFIDNNLSDARIADINTAVGAGATAATTRLTGFGRAVAKLQTALDNLWGLHHNGRIGRGPAAARREARLKVDRAFAELQRTYSIELRAFSPEAARAKNRGDAFSNSQRGITLAERKPNSMKKDVRLNVQNRLQGSHIATMGKVVSRAGNAAIGLDAGLRVWKVNEVHNAGGDWMRESVKQTTGFASGVAAGAWVGGKTFIGLSAVAASAGLIAAGPLGWAVLGTIFAVSLLSGYAAGKVMDNGAQWFTGWLMSR